MQPRDSTVITVNVHYIRLLCTTTRMVHVSVSSAMACNTIQLLSTRQAKVMDHIKTVTPHVTHIHYFSDGAAGQYKNFKNFANLVMHYKDFGISAQWHFLQHHMGKVCVMVLVEW